MAMGQAAAAAAALGATKGVPSKKLDVEDI
jgi:hypothetical protein